MKSRLVGREKLPIYIVGILLVLASFFSFQQEAIAAITGKIAGVIKDAETGEALPGANIIIVGTTMGAAADVDGYYFIIGVPPGVYSTQARMMGYTSVTKTDVKVSIGHTAPLNFELRSTTIKGKGITVEARREVIKMDLSSSSVAAESREITETPLVKDIGGYVSLQAGVEGWDIRGGGIDQTAFMVDGLMVVDNRSNKLVVTPNISSIKEFEIIKGGFNAEYGNVRSGVINVITKEGSSSEYHGSIDFRYNPPHLKHSGTSLFSPDNYYLRPYLDPGVCWTGTANGTWDEEEQLENKKFMGWDAVSAKLLSDKDPTNDRTPEECRDRFLWLHRAEGSGALGQREGKYGNKPDWNVDLGFGGPVPVISKYLGKLSFFTSYRTNWEMFALPVCKDYYKEENTQLKLTSHISTTMKLSIEGLYEEINSVASEPYGGNDYYLTNGSNMLNWLAPTEEYLYVPYALNPFNVYRSMQGVSFDHALSPSTFYNVRISHTRVKNLCTGPLAYRDTTTVRYFGNTPMDESPYGFWWESGTRRMTDHQRYCGGGSETRDWSGINTLNAKFDLTSQIDKYNQIKTGWIFNYDDTRENYGHERLDLMIQSWTNKYTHFPYRAGAYIQDKIEFEGMIANLGLRLDYNEPNCDWYTVERYSKYFKRIYKDVFTELAPKEPAKGHLKISPRLGISHPISANAKLYFNYGHFYSMPQSEEMYGIHFGSGVSGVDFIGNPSAKLPRTVAYELGVEYNIANLFLLHLSGYYKDVNDQVSWIWYENYDGSVGYNTIENNNYQDIRGFEFSLDKRFGRWITGWLNYNYMATTSGYVGRGANYQDPRKQKIWGEQNPYQERPIARPIFHSNVIITIPKDWGPTIAGIKPFEDFSLGFLYTWQAGWWTTWDPLRTYKLVDNLQWKPWYNCDARLSKLTRLWGYDFELFADIKNLFNTKYLDTMGFSDWEDQEKYYKSLHLPMYGGTEGATEEDYKSASLVAGNDKPGDIKSKEKPYIDMPNREFLTYFNLRTFSFGLRIHF